MKRYFRKTRESGLILPVHVGLAGRYKLEAIRPDGRRRPLADWFSNIITDGGLNRMGTDDYLTHCHVGTGSGAPATTDTALGTFVASTNTFQSSTAAAQGSAPYYGSQTNVYRFAAGEAEGNLSEVGIGWGGTSSGPLFSRALILDGGGSPTTITVLSDEVLDVTYELRVVPPTGDESYNVDDDGPAGTTHAVVLRAAEVTSATASTAATGWGTNSQVGSNVFLLSSPSPKPRAYSGALGAITGSPSGTTDNGSSTSNTSYVNNSLERVSSAFFDLNDGNVGDIAALRFGFASAGMWQASFTPAIPKDNTKVVTFGLSVSWGRAA